MYDRILFPTDGSDAAEAVLEYVLDVAEAGDATLYVLNVADTSTDSVTRIGTDVVDALELEGEELVEETAKRARGRGIEVVTQVEQGDPSATIVEYADLQDVDLIAMATHGRRGLDRMLLGSVTERVARKASPPVLTIRPDDDVAGEYPPESVLVPTDGSPVAAAAVDEAAALAAEYGARLHVLTIVDPAVLGYDVHSAMATDVLEDRAESILDDAVERAEDTGAGDVVRTTEFGSPRRTIVRYAADESADLVVMGTHGRSGIDRFLMGSVTEGTVRTAPVPVLTVRSEEAGAGVGDAGE